MISVGDADFRHAWCVNFAHGALFMIGAFCAVTLNKILTLSKQIVNESRTDFLNSPLKLTCLT